jgi:hypothetical protein
LLADKIIAGLLPQFKNELGPIGRKPRQVARSRVGAARSRSCDVNEYDRQASFAESAREVGRAADDFSGGVYCWHGDDAFLQVDYD